MPEFINPEKTANYTIYDSYTIYNTNQNVRDLEVPGASRNGGGRLVVPLHFKKGGELRGTSSTRLEGFEVTFRIWSSSGHRLSWSSDWLPAAVAAQLI